MLQALPTARGALCSAWPSCTRQLVLHLPSAFPSAVHHYATLKEDKADSKTKKPDTSAEKATTEDASKTSSEDDDGHLSMVTKIQFNEPMAMPKGMADSHQKLAMIRMIQQMKIK
mmetsp:Transcript_2058/g.3256  ORF Transcript_2058/g.3256 Transcript_2058/m.3256 type:complete len:115 (+) Transcript_2058:65-409(+)|eukprot:CAMPEP_0119107414 /NCGR_PEP_ID=MMETSP1180-20130426/9953_1 /TAXON_ID=3052 ORGANISM="Chlamydomonas cf sp, Strain CCMP681" /NCGR_SAMPLE_ID=MMETSP1180 /ASSEMBLY_ACC=CAM_ASM_000741 /LENGTH=114 /DNA_ID=CAMNT_0007092897 /DNA_START=65 /DNA_END=409 /DNA_ORIENTATION=+